MMVKVKLMTDEQKTNHIMTEHQIAPFKIWCVE